MRSSIKDRTSWPWSPEPTVKLFWLGSTPSGASAIVELRREIRKLLCGPGFHQEFVDGKQLYAPAIVHAGEFNPTPDNIVVCGVVDAASMNPWMCPLDPVVYTADQAAGLILQRADADEWLARLSGETLLCLNGCSNERCWAVCLRGAFINKHGEDRDSGYVYEFKDEDDFWTEDDGHDVFVHHRDEIEATTSSKSCVPRHVPWLASWHGLVDSIRCLNRPCFWEIFAGRAMLTKAFRYLGVTCAAPLDAVTNPDFNLLDAGFLTVVLGILGAHLVDLAHVAPPCASFSVALNGYEHSK